MQILRSSVFAAAIALATLFLSSLPAKAQTVGISFVPSGSGAYGIEDYASDNLFGNGVSSYNLGYEFTVNSPITVTSLGYFYDPTFWGDAPDQGFTQDHSVGIYNLSGDLLASAVVSQNVANDTRDGYFQYVSLGGSGLNLAAGQSYIISGITGPTDPYLEDYQNYSTSTPTDGLITPSEITYIQDYSVVSGTLSTAPSPSNDGNPGSYFGPDFQFQDNNAVPEPSTLMVFGMTVLMIAGALGIRRSRNRRMAVNGDTARDS